MENEVYKFTAKLAAMMKLLCLQALRQVSINDCVQIGIKYALTMFVDFTATLVRFLALEATSARVCVCS